MQSGISFCCLDYNCLVVPCIYVLSLPLFFCDCWVLCQFYSGTVFLYICVYVTVLFIKEEEEEEEEEEDTVLCIFCTFELSCQSSFVSGYIL